MSDDLSGTTSVTVTASGSLTYPQPRPAGTEWWCTTCQGIVTGIITPDDTEMYLVDRVRCPNAETVAHPDPIIGTVATARTDAPIALEKIPAYGLSVTPEEKKSPPVPGAAPPG
jgi:hypothetical protein